MPSPESFNNLDIEYLLSKPSREASTRITPLKRFDGWNLRQILIRRPGGEFSYRVPSLVQAYLHPDWGSGLAIIINLRTIIGDLRQDALSITEDTSVLLRYRDKKGKNFALLFKPKS